MAVVEYERRGHVAIITMNKPERLNAMGQDMMQGLAENWTKFRDDGDAWVAILTGNGRAFSAGMDIKERVESGNISGMFTQPTIPDPWWNEELEKPTIAAVNGYALGGGFFFTSRCDLRIAAETAVFQITEVARSRLAGYEIFGTENLPYAISAELCAGATITAHRAYEIGFINKVVPLAQLMPTAIEMAEGLLNYPPLAVHYNLKLLRDIRRERGRRRLPILLIEQVKQLQDKLGTTQDMQESMLSFVEKRAPVYHRR